MMSSKLLDMEMMLMLVYMLYFVSSAMKSEMDSIPTTSSCNELPLPLHSPYNIAKYIPPAPAVERTQPKIIWCSYFQSEYLQWYCISSISSGNRVNNLMYPLLSIV